MYIGLTPDKSQSNGTWAHTTRWLFVGASVLAAITEVLPREVTTMSTTGKKTKRDPAEFDTQSSTFEPHVGEATIPLEGLEVFADLLKKLSKANWFCDVEEA